MEGIGRQDEKVGRRKREGRREGERGGGRKGRQCLYDKESFKRLINILLFVKVMTPNNVSYFRRDTI